MTNLEIRVFSESIRNYVNTSGLPSEVKKMVLSDVLREIIQKAETELAAEIRERDLKEVKENAESV